MKIAIDLDEVIAEFLESFLGFCDKKFDQKYQKENFFSYNFWEVMGEDRAKSIERTNLFYDSDFFDQIKPCPGAISAVKKIAKNNQIFIITARPVEWKEKTIKWIKKYFGDAETEVVFTGLGHHHCSFGKSDVCLEYGAKAIAEDVVDYALDCANSGIKVLLFDKPWNHQLKEHKNISRVKNWRQALKELSSQ